MYRLLGFLVVLAASAKASYVVTVYGDVLKDKWFFTYDFPYLINNIGGDITVEYQLLGSGYYSVPQMCALNQLSQNTYLQALYLKCEAEGTASEICLCRSGINSEVYHRCVLEGSYMTKLAYTQYSGLNIEASPVLEIWPILTVYDESHTGYLKKICSVFSDDERPTGCVKQLESNLTAIFERNTVLNFDCNKVKLA